MPQVERAGRVGRDELDHERLPLAAVGAPERLVRLEDRVEDGGHGACAQAEVQKARARHLHRGDAGGLEVESAGELLRDLPGGPPEPLRERERDVRGDIPVRGVARALHADAHVVHAELRERLLQRRADGVLRRLAQEPSPDVDGGFFSGAFAGSAFASPPPFSEEALFL